MRPIVLIPARRGSSRLPDKVLAEIAGVPMAVQVLRRALEADIGPVAVATDDEAVFEVVRAAGGTAVMTRTDHPSGSDRIHEALGHLDPEERHDIVVNLQGDLPTLAPADVAATLPPFAEPSVDITTLIAEIRDEEERTNPNVVKAVVAFSEETSRTGRALYFSRATVPANEGPHWHHIGIYAYRREALERFVSLPPALLERREKLEQLRALSNGMRIDAVRVDSVPLGVDTLADLERARAILGG